MGSWIEAQLETESEGVLDGLGSTVHEFAVDHREQTLDVHRLVGSFGRVLLGRGVHQRHTQLLLLRILQQQRFAVDRSRAKCNYLRVVAGVDDGVVVVEAVPEEVQEINEDLPRSVVGLVELKLLEEGLDEKHDRVRREATYN